MFEFMSMAGNYEDRLVANTVINDVEIDTVAVTDSDQPYETGIQSKAYNNGDWVIVEMYETEALAEDGHKKWIETFGSNEFPSELNDVSTSSIKKLAQMLES